MDQIQSKPTFLFWIISGLATLWNIFGVMAYLGQAYMTDEMMSGLSETEQLYYSNLPSWVVSAFALAVFAGFFGCLGLFLRKKWAFYLFNLSFLALLVQTYYNFFVQNYIEIQGPKIILPFITFLVAIFLIYFSKSKIKSGVLR